MSTRLPLGAPKQWGMTDQELATLPLSFRDVAPTLEALAAALE